jgi:D-Tyr-tRNAtyr deacylase
LNDLLKIAESSENKLHRTLALRGFIQLLGLESERSDKETICMYSRAMNLATSENEKKRVLSALAQVKSLEALSMSEMYLEDEKLSSEAEFAVIKIAENIYEQFPQQVKNTLNQLLITLKNDSLRKQVQELILKIDSLEEQQNEKP